MAETAREAEKTIDRASMASRLTELASTIDQAIASTSVLTASRVGAKAIMAFTESGTTAARVASFRPVAPLIALYREPAAGRALSLRWGVTAIPTRNLTSIQWMFHEGSRVALETGYASDGDLIVVVLGLPPGASGNTNLLRVVTLPEPEPTFDQQRFDEIRDSR
jgi:pyruvate kinase